MVKSQKVDGRWQMARRRKQKRACNRELEQKIGIGERRKMAMVRAKGAAELGGYRTVKMEQFR